MRERFDWSQNISTACFQAVAEADDDDDDDGGGAGSLHLFPPWLLSVSSSFRLINLFR